MKSFIFSKSQGKRGSNGSCKLTFYVYQIIKNMPVYIGYTEASSGSYKGDESHVMGYLIEQGKIPKKYAGYYKLDLPFSIKGI